MRKANDPLNTYRQNKCSSHSTTIYNVCKQVFTTLGRVMLQPLTQPIFLHYNKTVRELIHSKLKKETKSEWADVKQHLRPLSVCKHTLKSLLAKNTRVRVGVESLFARVQHGSQALHNYTPTKLPLNSYKTTMHCAKRTINAFSTIKL